MNAQERARKCLYEEWITSDAHARLVLKIEQVILDAEKKARAEVLAAVSKHRLDMDEGLCACGWESKGETWADHILQLQPAAHALEEYVLDQYGVMCDCGKRSLQVVSIRTGFSGESSNYCSECASGLVEALDKGDLKALPEEARREEWNKAVEAAANVAWDSMVGPGMYDEDDVTADIRALRKEKARASEGKG